MTVGDPVRLDCKVSGSPELRVRWMKDGRELQSIRQHKLLFEKNLSSLKIQSAQTEDQGDYVLEVSNHISSCSCSVRVTVLGRFHVLPRAGTTSGTESNALVAPPTEQVIAPGFLRPLVDMQELLGSFVQICCKVSGSLPIAVEWQKDGSRVSSGVKHKVVQQDNSVSIELEHLERSDAGFYSCRVTNAAGSCECSASLRVKGQAAFSAQLVSKRHPEVSPVLIASFALRTPQLCGSA